MSYHNTGSNSNNANQRTNNTSSNANQRTNNASSNTVVAPPPITSQPVAPIGFHFMADGTLMSDDEHARLSVASHKIITAFDLDLSDIPGVGERRLFSIFGSDGAEFRLEIKDNTSGYYYNFVTNVFQAASAYLENSIEGGSYKGGITFPVVTGSDDQYNVFLYAIPGTKHQKYNEVRFGDGSLDVNSSTGSNSLMMTKVIYQYTALTLTIAGYSIGAAVAGTFGNDTISIDRGKPQAKLGFSFTTTAATTAAYRLLNQPTQNDVISFLSPVIGEAPIDLPGENIYPTATAAFTGDDINGAITSGAIVEIDADVAGNVVIGDKITTPVTTDTVNGAVTSGVVVTMDSVTATKMAVGDQVTGNSTLDRSVITVVETGGSTFKLSEAVAIADGITLTFSSKINRSLTTVLSLDPSGEAKQFTMSQDIQFRDNAPLTFFNQMNFSWPINNFAHLLREGMTVVSGTNVTAGTAIAPYRDVVAINEGTINEKVIVKNTKQAIDTLSKKPTIAKGLVTVQEGQITFNKQQKLILAGQTLKVGGYGEGEILRLYGWEVKFSDLKIALTTTTTTTTEATSAHATIAVTSKEGVINGVSRVSGIGMNPLRANPIITSGGGATGSGDWVMEATQSLENGTTLTVKDTSRVATITGNIQVIKAGVASQTIRFLMDRLISTSAPS